MRHPTTLLTLAQYRQQEIALQAAQIQLVRQACATPPRPEERAHRRRLPALLLRYVRMRHHASSALHG